MFRIFLTCAVSMVGLVAVADEMTPKMKRIIELGEIRRKERIAELEGGIKAMKGQYEGIKKSTYVDDQATMDKTTHRLTTPAELEKRKEAERNNLKERATVALQELEAIKRMKYYYPSMTLKDMQVGDVGILTDPYGAKLTAKITQIVDDETVIITVDSQPLCLTVDTAGLKVGKKFSMSMAFEVTGTTKHKSVGGGKKEIFVLEQFFFNDDVPAPKQTANSRTARRR